MIIRGEGKIDKQTGGKGQYAVVFIEVTPNGNTESPVVTDNVIGGSIPKQFIPSVIDGIEKACSSGPLEGWPVVGLDIAIVDGKTHSVDSSKMVFEQAAALAMKDVFSKARFSLLEPIANVSLIFPMDVVSDVMSFLTKKKATICDIVADEKTKNMEIKLEMPMEEIVTNFVTELRNVSQGKATYSSEFLRWAIKNQ